MIEGAGGVDVSLTLFYIIRASLHFVKMLVGDDPQTPEIVNYVDGCVFKER